MLDQKSAGREPLLRVAKRGHAGWGLRLGVRAAAIILALLADALFIYCVTGQDPISAYTIMWNGTFATDRRIMKALSDLAPLLMIAIALAPAFRMRFWNIGAEGQVLMGALATAIFMYYYGKTLVPAALYPLMLVTSILMGALWGVIPAIFKAKFSTNETLFTLMMNYVAMQIVSCYANMWRGAKANVGIINMMKKQGWLPKLFGQDYGINLLVAAVLVIAMFLYLRHTKQGYEIAVVGESVNTARYAGIRVSWVIIRTMLISGGLCGLTGFLIVAGQSHTISANTAGGNGFTAIIVAWLAKFNTFVMLLIAALLIFLKEGSKELQANFPMIDAGAAAVIEGIILFFILGSEFFVNYRLIFRGHAAQEGGVR